MHKNERKLKNLLEENMDVVENHKELFAEALALMGNTVSHEILTQLPGSFQKQVKNPGVSRDEVAKIIAQAEVEG